MQDLYRQTLAAYWASQPGELRADECIEDIFSGGDGWGKNGRPVASRPGSGASTPNPEADAPSRDNSMTSKTTDTDRMGHRRTDTVKIEGEDYFLQPGKVNSDSKSAPGTPQPMASKSIVFSPRIQFHETWPSGEYDRRGEIATCNKLTPLLAQQIKEELNTFKMVIFFSGSLVWSMANTILGNGGS